MTTDSMTIAEIGAIARTTLWGRLAYPESSPQPKVWRDEPCPERAIHGLHDLLAANADGLGCTRCDGTGRVLEPAE
jgi:hypothetical protein